MTDSANLGDGDSLAAAGVDDVGQGAGGDIASDRFFDDFGATDSVLMVILN